MARASLGNAKPDIKVVSNQASTTSKQRDSKVAKNLDRKGQTLRLTPDAWKQLKMLAIEQDQTSHALLIDAVNMLFMKHKKPPIA